VSWKGNRSSAAGRKPCTAGPYLPLTSAAADVQRFFPCLTHVKRDVDKRQPGANCGGRAGASVRAGHECGPELPRLSTLQRHLRTTTGQAACASYLRIEERELDVERPGCEASIYGLGTTRTRSIAQPGRLVPKVDITSVPGRGAITLRRASPPAFVRATWFTPLPCALTFTRRSGPPRTEKPHAHVPLLRIDGVGGARGA
jgi:hypothetical protein